MEPVYPAYSNQCVLQRVQCVLRLRSDTNFLAGAKRKSLKSLRPRPLSHPDLYLYHNGGCRIHKGYAQFRSASFRAGKSDGVVAAASFGILKQACLAEALVCRTTLYFRIN